MERFLTKVRKTPSCWVWTAYKNPNGYGRFRIGKKKETAHRASWTIFKGQIPVGYQVLHTCDNPSCVNPGHLFLGTHLSNMRDMVSKGRHITPRKLTSSQVSEIKKLYESDNYYQREIAVLFNVSQALIAKIILGKRWAKTHIATAVNEGASHRK